MKDNLNKTELTPREHGGGYKKFSDNLGGTKIS